jgi:hypothetical protein
VVAALVAPVLAVQLQPDKEMLAVVAFLIVLPAVAQVVVVVVLDRPVLTE